MGTLTDLPHLKLYSECLSFIHDMYKGLHKIQNTEQMNGSI